MFEQISWTAYAGTIALLTLIYYVCTGLAFYRQDVRALFSTGAVSPPDPATDDILGPVQAEPMAVVSPGELAFAPAEDTAGDRLAALFAEMAAEIKTLSQAVKAAAEPEASFGNLFRLLAQRYPELRGTLYQERLTALAISEGYHINDHDWTTQN